MRNWISVAGEKSVLFLTLLLLAVPMLRAQSGTRGAATEAVGAVGTVSTVGGAKNFKEKCVLCHGADGSGNTDIGKAMGTPNFRSSEIQQRTDAELIETITKGKNKKMPTWAGKLTPSEIKDLVAHIRQLSETK